MHEAPWYYCLVSAAGMLFILGLARLSGLGRGRARWRPVAWGVAIQLAMAALFFLAPPGRQALIIVNSLVVALLGHAQAGIQFLFGPLGIGPGQEGSLGFILAVQALPTVIFFMALTAILYQAGIMQRLVSLFARLFVRVLGTSGAESLGVASNIFVGVESAGMVRPFLAKMTHSELFCLLTAAMSTVASSTMGIYVSTLQDIFPNIAGHLVSASLISAPAAIVVAKLMVPETGEPETLGRPVSPETGRYGSLMEAVTQGSLDGVRLVVGIGALLLSFLGLVSLLNGMLGGALGWVGLPGISMETVLGWLAWPLALAMGVPPVDAGKVAELLGQRALVTEIPAYVALAKLMQTGGLEYARSGILAAYALCGFTHVGSVAIFVGGFGALAPGRMGELARLGFLALWAATLATVMTGCAAGIFAGAGMLLSVK